MVWLTLGSTKSKEQNRKKTLAHNYAYCQLIFQILSPADSVINLQQIHIYTLHRTLNVLLHYLVKYVRKMAAI